MSRALKALGLGGKCLDPPLPGSLHAKNFISSRAELLPAWWSPWEPQGLGGAWPQQRGISLSHALLPMQGPSLHPATLWVHWVQLPQLVGAWLAVKAFLEPTFRTPNLEAYLQTVSVSKLRFNFLSNFSAKRAGISYKSNQCTFHETFPPPFIVPLFQIWRAEAR